MNITDKNRIEFVEREITKYNDRLNNINLRIQYVTNNYKESEVKSKLEFYSKERLNLISQLSYLHYKLREYKDLLQ